MLSQLDHHALAQEFKIRASLLHKTIKQLSQEASPSKEHLFEIAARLQKLPQWEKHLPTQLFAELKKVQLKHCLYLIAIENGYHNWTDFLEKMRAAQTIEDATEDREVSWYRYGMNEASLNHWYADYASAKKHLDGLQNNFLLPYKNHFFICNAVHIKELGLNPADKDWSLIGRDCARPNDLDAFERLKAKLKLARLNLLNT